MTMQKQLQELKALHAQGLITDDVYAEQQRGIIAGTMVKKPSSPLWQQLLLAIFVVLTAIWLFYHLSDRKGKDTINTLVTQTRIGTLVIPWADRADTELRQLIPRNSEAIASAILASTHPSGKNPMLGEFKVSKLDGRVLVELPVVWKGGLLGNAYRTVIVWEISEANHVSAKVVADSAVLAIDAKDRLMIDDYFRTKVYPAFYSDMSGGT